MLREEEAMEGEFGAEGEQRKRGVRRGEVWWGKG